jgi:hypothetical protein
MDSDDISLPQRLERQVEYMDANPEVGVCGSWVEAFSDACCELWAAPQQHEAIVAKMVFESALYHPAVIMRRAYLVDSGLEYVEDFDCAQDYELWGRCARHFRLANLGEVLLRYRLHDKSVGRSRSARQRDCAYRVRKMWLSKLGLQPTSDEMTLHQRISAGEVEVNTDFLERSQSWLQRLAEANTACGALPEVELLQELASRWFLVCNRTTRLGPNVFRAYIHSPLSRHFPGRRVDVVALAAKSFLRRTGR